MLILRMAQGDREAKRGRLMPLAWLSIGQSVIERSSTSTIDKSRTPECPVMVVKPSRVGWTQESHCHRDKWPHQCIQSAASGMLDSLWMCIRYVTLFAGESSRVITYVILVWRKKAQNLVEVFSAFKELTPLKDSCGENFASFPLSLGVHPPHFHGLEAGQ